MACPFTVKQVIQIFRQYGNDAKGNLAVDSASLVQSLTGFEFKDYETGAISKLSLGDAVDIVVTFEDLYRTWLNNIPKSASLQRLLEKTMKAKAGIDSVDDLVQAEIDYMLIFQGTSEMALRGEKLEVALMKMYQRNYNANIMRDGFFATLLSSASFFKGMIIDNIFQSFFRKLTTAIAFKSFPDFTFQGSADYAKSVYQDVIKGGIPINTVMEQEIRDSGIFTDSARASEYGTKRSKYWGAYLKYNAFATKWIQRVNNVADSVGQTISMERSFFKYLSKVIDKQTKANNLFSLSDGIVVTKTDDLIEIESQTGEIKSYYLKDPSMLPENRLKHSRSASQQQYQFRDGDYKYFVSPNIKIGAIVSIEEPIAEFRLTGVGKARQMQGQGYYYSQSEAEKVTKEMYEKAGLIVVAEGANTDYQININSGRFKRSVHEIQRQGRDITTLEAAEKTAMHDFFKNPMGVYTTKNKTGVKFNYLELPNQGVFGFVAATTRVGADVVMPWLSNGMLSVTNAVYSLINKRNVDVSPERQQQFQALFRVSFFGFVNGANAYAENLIEYSPYGLIKAGVLKGSLAATEKGLLTDAERMFYEQRVNDLVAKPLVSFLITGLVFALKFAIEESGLCDDEGGEPSLEDVKNGSIVICGRRIPSAILGMSRTWVGLYNWFLHDDKGRGSIAFLAFMTGGKYGDRAITTTLNTYLYAQTQEQAQSSKGVVQKLFVKGITDVIALHLPAKGLIGSNALFFPDKEVEPITETVGQIFKWSALQSIGMKEAVLSSTGEYNVVDYRGRSVFNNTLKYQIGDGLKYDKYDDLINNLSLDGKDLYNGRYRKLFSDQNKFGQYVAPRFMTEKEFHHTQLATGRYFDEWMKMNYKIIQSLPDEKNRRQFSKQEAVRAILNELEGTSKEVAQYFSPEFGRGQATEENYYQKMAQEVRERYNRKLTTYENSQMADLGISLPDPLDLRYKTISQEMPKAAKKKPM